MKRNLTALVVIVSVTALLLAVDPGRFAFAHVDAGGHKLRMLILGRGGPTVVFETGARGSGGAPLEMWERIQSAVSKFTSTVTYDRAGVGWSAPGPEPRDARQIAFELHTALKNAGVPPPYVLVGHSFGGPFIRVFAGMYPASVAGMVLVDPTQEGFIQWETAAKGHSDIPDKDWKLIQAGLAEAHESVVPAGIPVVLITGMGPREFPSFTTEKQQADYRAGHRMWLKFHTEWLDKIPGGKHIITEKSGHDVPIREPELVVNAISNVVAQARSAAGRPPRGEIGK